MKKLILLLTALLVYNFALPQEAKTFYKEAKKLSKANNHEAAIEKLTSAISKDKEFRDAYLLRAQCYSALKKDKQAAIDYKIAASQYPKKKDVQYETALILFNLSQYNEAIPFADKVLEIDPIYVPGLTLSYKTAYFTEAYTKAKISNDKALEEDKDNAEHYFYQGLIAFKQMNMPVAEKGLVECAKLNDNYKGVYTALAEVRYERKVYDKVIPTCNVAIKKDNNSEKAYYIKAEAQKMLNNTKASIQTMTDLLSNSSNKAHVYYQRGLYFLDLKDNDNAKKDFTSSINEDDNYYLAYNQRALLYELLNELKLASNDYQKVVDINRDVKIVENAKQRIFEINKESDAPSIKLISHEVDDKHTFNVHSNQPQQEIKIHINDASHIKKVAIDNQPIEFDHNVLNPLVKFNINAAEKEHFRVDVEDDYANKSSETYHINLKKIKPPKIAMTEPYASSNGETYVDKDVNDLFVEGKITHSEKIKSISVNGIPASFLHDKENPSFSAKIEITNLTKFTIDVEGEFGTKSSKEFNLVRTEVSADNPMGKTWVIFIENSNYQNFSSLEGPTKDINLIKTSLADYSISKVIHKKDMSKDDLARFFSIELRDLIKKNRVNSLMVWYAGHGKFVNETGYWIPTDAKRDEEYSYYNINTLRASMQSYDNILVHNLVITDACESGPSFYLAMRDTPKERICGDWEATKFRSAQVLSSAGYELAMDNSQFTKTFAAMLNHNPDDCIPIEKISNKVVEAVAQTGNQKPSLGKIKGLSDQNGTFFFIKRK